VVEALSSISSTAKKEKNSVVIGMMKEIWQVILCDLGWWLVGQCDD
jgi:hypothetical protein